MLKDYSDHIESHSNCLLAKIFGVFKIEFVHIECIMYFILIENIAKVPKEYILKVYSLKGQNQSRKLLKRKDTIYECCDKVLKESDFIRLEGKLTLE
jgi:hypothetical protein